VLHPESYELHDHCQDAENDHCQDAEIMTAKIIEPPELSTQGNYLQTSIHLCTNGNFLLSIVHLDKLVGKRLLLNHFYTDIDLANLIAKGYIEWFDRAKYPDSLLSTYRQVYFRVTH